VERQFRLVSNGGYVVEPNVARAADDGQGAVTDASENPVDAGTQRVQFAADTSGAAMSGALNIIASVSYMRGVADGQFMRGTGVAAQSFRKLQSRLPSSQFCRRFVALAKRSVFEQQVEGGMSDINSTD
jgi:hypothetical protein